MKKNFCVIMVFILLIGFVFVESEADTDCTTSFSSMLSRAENIVNYEWTPTQRIYTWNGNEYNGQLFFEAGEKVKGVPYTLFSWELGFDSLLSLEQYKTKVNNNYSTTTYCSSVAANRIGPVYGTCCATFVSEVLGGYFMNGNNPRYDGVGGIERSSYGTCYRGVKAVNIQSGDALSCTNGGHIMWVGDVNDSYIKLYESTPPISKITVLDIASHTDANGFLKYNGNFYNIVTKSNQIIRDDLSVEGELDYSVPMPIKAYTLSTEKTIVYDSIEGDIKHNKIYSTDACFIDAVFKNGWCHVNFPLDSGGLDHGYVRSEVFFDDSYNSRTIFTQDSIMIFTRSDATSVLGNTGVQDSICIVGETVDKYQVVYPLSAGGYKMGWCEKTELENESPSIKNAILTLSNTVISPGDAFTVWLHLSENPGLTCLQISLQYDDLQFELIDIANGDVLTESFTFNEKSIQWYSHENVSAIGTLCILHFKAKKTITEGEYAINVNVSEGNDAQENVIVFDTEQGIIYVNGFLFGDVNNDGEINGKDVIRLRKYLLTLDETTGLSDVEIGRGADCNGDGEVNGKDLIRLRKSLLYND